MLIIIEDSFFVFMDRIMKMVSLDLNHAIRIVYANTTLFVPGVITAYLKRNDDHPFE